ncbi:MAG TPA: pilus assembly protein TadG-related protein [Gemmataceae bacterium]|jgi:hypothetical protein
MRLSLHPSPTRDGGVTPLTVLSLSLLVSVVAVAVDGGALFEHRRHVQAAADAAALAAAADLFANYPTNQGADPKGTAAASALANAAANGFSNDGVQSTVTVNLSPQNYQGGSKAGQPVPAGYVEVIVQYNAGRTFSSIFSSGSIPVRARAVARGQWTPLSNLVTSFSLTASAAVSVSGLAGLSINGAMQVNSRSTTAVSLTGTAGLSTSQITLNPSSGGGLIASIESFLSGLGKTSPTITTNPSTPDPLRYLSAPDLVQLGLSTQGTNLVIGNTNTDLYPGVYNGGITVNGSATVTLHANADGTPGIYYLQGGGFALSSTAKIQTASTETAGVMIYNDWQSSSDAISVSVLAGLQLTPPTSGIYKGISIFQKRGTFSSSGPAVSIGGLGAINVTGLIYAAHANVNLSGQSSTNVMAGAVLADTLNVSGLAVVNINPGSSPVACTRLYGLVE